MIVNGLMKTTLLDYPGHVAATLFLGGCNFRCPFCHNRDMVLYPQHTEQFPEEEILAFLKKRYGVLSGVCITGGEPTLRKDLPEFLSKIKDLGYLVKLDTNGTHPEIIRSLNEAGLIDYVAMDVKAAPFHYGEVAGITEDLTDSIKTSIDYIRSSLKDYEFRTTVVKGLHTARDFEEIGPLLKGANAYYLQYFRNNDNLIVPGKFSTFATEEMEHFLSILHPYVKNASIRGEMPTD